MEPERKIEKWLRAYAKKRRAEAGEPLKLDPANRRILQKEVLQQAVKPRQNAFSGFMCALFQPSVEYVLGFAALVLVVGAFLILLIPAQKTSKGERPAYTALAKAPSAPSAGAKSKPVQDKSKVDHLATGGAVQTVMPVTSSAQLAVAAPERSVSSLSNLFRNASAAARATPVLQSFQVQQNGNAIFVVDADGSVYSGSVQLATAKAREEPVSAKSLAPPVSPSPGRARTSPPVENEQRTLQNYSFHVAGVNRTLRQNVVFTGNMETAPGMLVNGRQFFSAGGNLAGGGTGGQDNRQLSTNQLSQEFLPNFRIVGTAVIDRTNQVEINAVPVMP